MDLFIYSDESGVFKKETDDFYIFGGLIMLGSDQNREWFKRYSKIENAIQSKPEYRNLEELKGNNLSFKDENHVMRGLNRCFKFSIVIYLEPLHDKLFEIPVEKQRYLDRMFRIGVKTALFNLIAAGILSRDEVTSIHFFMDYHTAPAATFEELRMALNRQLKNGSFDTDGIKYYEPLFTNLKKLSVELVDSKQIALVRAADIIANYSYRSIRDGKLKQRFYHGILVINPRDEEIVIPFGSSSAEIILDKE